MTTGQKAIVFGLVTEAVAASFIVMDAHMEVAAAYDTVSLEHAPRFFYFLAQWAHWPAVILLGILDLLFEAALGLSGGKPAFFAGFATGNPAWGLICIVQAAIWMGFWAALFTCTHWRFSHLRHDAVMRGPSPRLH